MSTILKALEKVEGEQREHAGAEQGLLTRTDVGGEAPAEPPGVATPGQPFQPGAARRAGAIRMLGLAALVVAVVGLTGWFLGGARSGPEALVTERPAPATSAAPLRPAAPVRRSAPADTQAVVVSRPAAEAPVVAAEQGSTVTSPDPEPVAGVDAAVSIAPRAAAENESAAALAAIEAAAEAPEPGTNDPTLASIASDFEPTQLEALEGVETVSARSIEAPERAAGVPAPASRPPVVATTRPSAPPVASTTPEAPAAEAALPPVASQPPRLPPSAAPDPPRLPPSAAPDPPAAAKRPSPTPAAPKASAPERAVVAARPPARKAAPPSSKAPQVKVERTTWHPTPERRAARVVVEGFAEPLELREGDAVGVLVVSEIQPSGVVFLHGGSTLRRKVGR